MPSPIRVAWLFPRLIRGYYWQPVFTEFRKAIPETTVFTGDWSGFLPGFENSVEIETVGKTRFIRTSRGSSFYSKGFHISSPFIIWHLLRYKPGAIISGGFALWTIFSLFYKALTRCRVVILWDGSSPSIDFRDSPIRLKLRSTIASLASHIVTNSLSGKRYLVDILKVPDWKVLVRPYEVPSPAALSCGSDLPERASQEPYRPVILYVGQLIKRKGIETLLEACALLEERAYRNYAVRIVGDGPETLRLQDYARSLGISKRINWIGWVEYGSLGEYFAGADLLVHPSFEDCWGMVVLEAMAFGKPVVCSNKVGSAELISNGETGFTFSPASPAELAKLLQKFIDEPDLAGNMGRQARISLESYTPATAAAFLAEVVQKG